MRICTVGLGYIGLPTSALIAQKKIKVLGVDINPAVVDAVNNCDIETGEGNLKETIHKCVKDGYLFASLTAEKSEVYLIVVPTPFKGNNKPDISYVQAATESIIPLLKKGDLFIIESTSPVGTTEKMAKLIFSQRPDLKDDVYIAYCPERVIPGNIMYELVHNDRVIGGLDETSTDKACEFYSQIVKGELFKTNSRTAEMCKLTENASRDVQIAFANELSMICDKAGINVWELISLANKHPRVNILQPGCGVGGHCIAVDPWFIVSDYPKESRLIGAAREINNNKAAWCVEKILKTVRDFEINEGRRPRLALMGLAYKPNVDDLRESPAMYIATQVMQHDIAEELFIVEPNVKEHSIFKLTHYEEAFDKADIVVFLVAHQEFNLLEKTNCKTIVNFCENK